ncbi:MAG: hypothetical protein HYZ71_14225 [Deltaproteobacteria bacterium]|nr:hypothetical protein [Deltaproteobacteria bacterium]
MPKHGWNSLENYLSVHEKTLRFYEKYMETVRTYDHDTDEDNFYNLTCFGIFFHTYRGTRIRVDLEKDIEIDSINRNRRRARTYTYTYSANYPGQSEIIRYCGPHGDEREAGAPHHKRHHKHDYRKDPKGEVILLGDDEWPHVGEFLQEVLSSF